mgnify:CR=1 FL=1
MILDRSKLPLLGIKLEIKASRLFDNRICVSLYVHIPSLLLLSWWAEYVYDNSFLIAQSWLNISMTKAVDYIECYTPDGQVQTEELISSQNFLIIH